jgi:hypothetical protein
MSKLHLRFKAVNGQTRTLIGKKNDHEDVVFHNDDPERVLIITFNPAGLLRDDTGRVNNFEVPPLGKVRLTLKPNAAVGNETKYTATIAGSAPEDPIIIVEN